MPLKRMNYSVIQSCLFMQKRRGTKVDIDLGLSAFSNARRFVGL